MIPKMVIVINKIVDVIILLIKTVILSDGTVDNIIATIRSIFMK